MILKSGKFLTVFSLVFILTLSPLGNLLEPYLESSPLPEGVKVITRKAFQTRTAFADATSTTTPASEGQLTTNCADNGNWTQSGTSLGSDDSDYSYTGDSKFDSGDNTDGLQAYNFGFAMDNVASIDGIIVEVLAWASAADVSYQDVYLLTQSTVSATRRGENGSDSSTLPTSEPSPGPNYYKVFGGVDDDWYAGGSWSEAEIESSEFGVELCLYSATNSNVVANVDQIRVTVFYTQAGIDISGKAYQDEGITPLANGTSISLYKNGSTLVGNTTTSGGDGSWTISDGFISGDILTAYIDNDATYKGSVIMVSDGTTQTNVDIYGGSLVLRDDVDGIVTNANVATGWVDDYTDMMATTSGSTNITATSSANIHVFTGDTYQPGGTVTTQGTGDLRVATSSIAFLDTTGNTIAGDIIAYDSSLVYINQNTAVNGGSIEAQGTNNDGNFLYSEGAFTPVVTLSGTGNIRDGNATSTFYALTTSGSGTNTTQSNIDLDQNLTVGANTTVSVGGYNFTVGGATSITGELAHTNSAGTKTYTGDITINSGGTWSNAGNEDFAIAGSLTNNQTFTSGTGTYTFSGSTKDISGTVSFDNLAITGTVTNNNTLTVNTALSGAGTLTQAASATLNLGGTITVTTLDATAASNIVNYTAAAGGQTVKGTTYSTLNIQNTSNTDTANAAVVVNTALTTASNGTFDMSIYQLSGAFTPTNIGTLKTSNTTNPAIPASQNWGGTVEFAASGQSVPAGTYNNLTFSSSSGTNTAVGALTVNGTLTTTSGGTLDMSTYQLDGTLSSISNDGTLKTGNTGATPIPASKTWGGTVDYSGAAGQTAVAGTFNNLTISNTSAAVTTTANISAGGDLTVGGSADFSPSAGTVTMTGGSIANSGTLAFYNLEIAGSVSTGATFSVTGDMTSTSGTLSTSGGTITVTGDLSMAGTIDGTGSITVNGGDITGDGTINMTGGTFLLDGTGLFGGNTNWTFNELTFGDGSGVATTTSQGSGSITAATTTIANSQIMDAGVSKTWNLTTSWEPLQLNGSLLASTSSFIYQSTDNATVTPATYYNLEISPPSGSPTFKLGTTSSQTITIQNNFTIAGAGNATVDATTRDPNLDINNSFSIGSSDVFQASDSASFTIANDFTNNGTFTHNNGTLVLDTTNTATISSAANMSFYKLTVTTAGKSLWFEYHTANVPTFSFDDQFTVTGAEGNNINIRSSVLNSQWLVDFNVAQTSITYVTVRDSACVPGSYSVAYSDTNSGEGNNGYCWNIGNKGASGDQQVTSIEQGSGGGSLETGGQASGRSVSVGEGSGGGDLQEGGDPGGGGEASP